MASIVKTVDITTVNFEQIFTYNMNISFDGIEGNINSASVSEFIPDFISYTLPNISSPINSITQETVTGGTLITFEIGKITNVGVSLSLEIQCRFKLGTDNNTSFTNHVDLYINETLETSYDSKSVTLIVEEDFFIEKNIIVPSSQESSPGGRVIYTITITNRLKSQGGSGDLGAKIKNIFISDTLPNGISRDNDFEISGIDISNNSYSDTRYDGNIGVINGDNITISIPEYYGTSYRIACVCNVDTIVNIGSTLENTVTWEVDSNQRPSSTAILNIGNKTYEASANKYGPNYAQVGNYASFQLNVGNIGNQDLINMIIKEVIPNEITPYRISTGSFMIEAISIPISESYTIEYEINNSGVYNSLGLYNLSNSIIVNLPQLEQNQKITSIVWNIPNIQAGVVQNENITIDSIINSTNIANEISSISIISWDSDIGRSSIQATYTTYINQLSELRVSKNVEGNVNKVIPKQIITYSITFNGYGSQVNNPVVSDLISNKVSYIGNERYIFYDYFNNTTIDSSDAIFSSVVPIKVEVINNFNSTGLTLIRYDMNGFSLRQRGIFTIKFDVEVNIGATGTIINNATLGNRGNFGVVGAGYQTYLDVDDRDGDLITNEAIALSNTVYTSIEYYAGLSSVKKVKGELDNDYIEVPSIGTTYAGGKVNYQIMVTNIGNLDFNYIEIVDIFPHPQDTGVIITNIQRMSQFTIYNIQQIAANIIDINNNNINNAQLDIEYSSSYDPVRFSKDNFGNDNIGTTNDWSKTTPTPITNVRSVKISTINTALKPNQSLIIDIVAIVPIGVTPLLVTWNSFAVKSNYTNEQGNISSLIPIEPQKVGIQIQGVNKSSIGGIIWLDKNENGMIDSNESGINGINLYLYSENGDLIKETVTTNNINNVAGYYLFNNLDIGNYYVKFAHNEGLYSTLYTDYTDNKFDTNTDETNIIKIINENEYISNINGGLINKIDLLVIVFEFLHEYIYSIDCSSESDTVKYINYLTSIFINILSDIYSEYELELINIQISDYGYNVQLERLLYVLKDMKSKLIYINIPLDYCNIYIISNIVYILTQYCIQLINIIEYHNGILKFNSYCIGVGTKFYEFLMSEFINSTTRLIEISNNLNSILGILYSDLNCTSKKYVPLYIPKL